MTPCFGLMDGRSLQFPAKPFLCWTRGAVRRLVMQRGDREKMLITLSRLPGKRSGHLPGMTWIHFSAAACFGHGRAESKLNKTLWRGDCPWRMANHSDMPTTRCIPRSATSNILRDGPIKATDACCASLVVLSTISCMSLSASWAILLHGTTHWIFLPGVSHHAWQ